MMVRSNDSSTAWRCSPERGSRQGLKPATAGIAVLSLALVGTAGSIHAQQSTDRLQFADLQLLADDVDKPTSVHVVDIDDDGDHDILSASSNDSTVRLFKNMGVDAEEQFTEILLGTTEGGANSVTAADMDGDGDMDVVAAARLDDVVVWYEQIDMNSGTFKTFQNIGTDLNGASFAAVGDLDGDGDHDVVATGYEADELVWYENMGADGWSMAKVVDSSRDGPWMALVSDLNGDGHLDIAVAYYAGDEFTCYLNDGSGMFDAGTTMGSGFDGAAYLAEADLDHDGDQDLLFASYRDDRIGWFENLGDGEFSEANEIDVTVDGPASIATGDFDRDGDMDVAIASLKDDRVIAFESRSYGLGDPIEVSDSEVDGPRTVASGDVDDDGNWDIVVGGSKDDTIGWFENLSTLPRILTPPTAAPGNVSGSYGVESISMRWDPVPSSSNGGAPIIRYVATAVPVGDGGEMGQCVVSASEYRCRIVGLTPYVQYFSTVHAENLAGAGPESSPPVVAIPVEPSGEPAELSDEMVISDDSDAVTSIFPTDLDGDGDLDVLSASVADSTIAWFENLGDDMYSEKKVLSDTVVKSYSVRSGDLDSDGDVDVLATTRAGNAVVWFKNNGDGTFGEKETLVSDVPEAVFAMANDLDGDADQDVVFASYQGDYIAWAENMGSEGFSDPMMIATEVDGAWNLHVRDLNDDGRPDLMSASIKDDTIAWYLNEGGNEFTKHVLSDASDSAAYVYSRDLDNDGDPDILAASYNDDTVAWFENMGSNTFSERKVITDSADGAAAVHTGDIDLDGDQDVFAASIRDDTVAWFENMGGGEFGEAQVLSGHADGARSVYVSDVEDDGDVDVFVGTYYDDSVSWWKNLSSLPPPVIIDEEGPPTIAPPNVQVTAGVESLTVSWSLIPAAAGQNITAYHVQITSGADGTMHTCEVDATVTMCLFTELRSEVEYSVVVWAENGYGVGPASAPVVGIPMRRIFGISGSVFFENNFVLDGDTNNPDNVTVDNNSLDNPQEIPFPGNVTGWADTADDQSDFYRITFPVGVSLFLIHPAIFEPDVGWPMDATVRLFDLDAGSILLATQTPQDGGLAGWLISVTAGTWNLALEVNARRGSGGYMVTAGFQDPPADVSQDASIKQSHNSRPSLVNLYERPFVPGEAIVQLEASSIPGVPASMRVKELGDQYGFKIKQGSPDRAFLAEFDFAGKLVGNEIHLDGRTYITRDEETAARELTKMLIGKLRSSHHFRHVIPNGRMEAYATPNDPNFSIQWHYQNINLPDAWDVTTGSDDVVVAVIDSGYIDHPDLLDRLLRNDDDSIAGFDMVSDSGDSLDGNGIDSDPFDESYTLVGSQGLVGSHGSHIAGTIGAETDNGEHVAGVTWNTRIMPVRVFGWDAVRLESFATEYDISQGIRYAAGLENDSLTIAQPHARVANLSLGGNRGPGCLPEYPSRFWDDLHEEALVNGTILVWASGNDACGHTAVDRAHPDAVIVSGTGSIDQFATYSGYGDGIKTAAPAGTLEDLNQDGLFDLVYSTDWDGVTMTTIGISGTSQAAPHVVGVIALMLGANDNLTIHDALRLLQGIHPEWTQGPVTKDLGEPGWDPLFGFGLIDAKKAVDAASSIVGGLGPIQNPRLRITQKSVYLGSNKDSARVEYTNIGRGSDPLVITEVRSSQPWISGEVTEDGSVMVHLVHEELHLLPFQETGGRRRADVRVYSNGGTDSLITWVLVRDDADPGDVGQVYVLAVPEIEENPVLGAVLDTSSGEFDFDFLDVAPGRYIVFAGTDNDGDGNICDSGEMCGFYPDTFDLQFFEVDSELTPAPLYLQSLVVAGFPAIFSVKRAKEISRRIGDVREVVDIEFRAPPEK